MHIEKENSSWSFEGIANDFEIHARRSIPGYDQGHELVCKYSDFFCTNTGSVIDIGCSTGLLLNKIAKRHINKKHLTLIGIEPVEDMFDFANRKIQDKRIELINDSMENISFPKSNLIISYYTLQFVHPSIRQMMINKIYEHLEWGGAFLMFEKVRAADARFQDYASQIYNEFKLDNNFSEEEIINKSQSLKGVMEPFSSQGNIDLFRRAGFKDIVSIYKWVCFEGFLAIK
jgi:tRNA (cmo5U34)-methyltransferase